MGSYASLSVCMVVTGPKVLEKNIFKDIAARVMKFGQGIDVDDVKVDLEGQGHQVKKCAFMSLDSFTGNFEGQGQRSLCQGQRPHGSRSALRS